MSRSMVSRTEVTDEHARLSEDDMTTVPPDGAVPGTGGTRRRHRDSSQSYRLDRLGWIGVGLLLLQGVAMLAWSTLLWQRFALTFDYGAYHQAWWLIAHGRLDPFDTVLGFPFWQNNFELMMWPLALIGTIWSHGPVLLWLQDACLVGTEVVIWRWMREVTATRPGRQTRALAGIGLILLLADPWIWSSISFDFHMELVAVLFAVLATYDLAHGHRRAWLWVVLTLLCGEAEVTWMAGLGLAALLSGRRWRRQGLALLVLGVLWVGFATIVHGDRGGNVVGYYGYLAGGGISSHPTLVTLVLGTITHPGRALSVLFSHRVDIWANLAPEGLVGIVNPWALGLALPVLLADELRPGLNFAAPIFQSVLLYVMVPFGTVLVLVRLHGRWPRAALGLGAVLVVNALAWSAIWGPGIPTAWLGVSESSAAILARADAMIPPSAEVVVSQGVAGRFSDRSWLYPLFSASQRIPIKTRDTWWVITPSAGIETDPVVDAAALINELAGPLHAHLLLRGHGIWVFHWVATAGLHSLTLPGPENTKAWVFPGAAGEPMLYGPPSTWHLVSTGSIGYVLSGDYWRELPGNYVASVTLASTVAADIEVWNATGDVLLARRAIPATNGVETVSMPVDAKHVYQHHLFQGWGPFQARLTPTAPGNRLEIRVWTSGGGLVDVQQVQMRPIRRR